MSIVKHTTDKVGDSEKAIACQDCNGYCDHVEASKDEIKNQTCNGRFEIVDYRKPSWEDGNEIFKTCEACNKKNACCVRVFVCRICKTRWIAQVKESLVLQSKKHMNTPEFKKSIDEWGKKMEIETEIQDKRLKKVEKYLETHELKNILDRLIDEHDDKYRDRLYSEGIQPYPNNKLSLLMEYVSSAGEHKRTSKIDGMFLSLCCEFKGYWFTTISGQGMTVPQIYDKDFNLILNI